MGIVDGTAWVRTCQTPARPGLQVQRHPLGANPSMLAPVSDIDTPMRREHVDLVVVGGGPTGTLAGEEAAAENREVLVLDANRGEEVVAIFAGPIVVVRTPEGMRNLHAHEVIVATGAAELHPVCDGNLLAGIVTVRAAERLRERGIGLGRVVAVGPTAPGAVPGRLVRFDGADGRVTAVVVEEDDGTQRAYECDTVIVGLGTSPRDVLTRSNNDPAVRPVGRAALAHDLPPCPTSGVVCPCSKTTVEDLEGVWERGFREVELVKRSALAGTGTCQGAVCLPHVRAFVTERSGEPALPFTARPAARQLTMGEATAGCTSTPGGAPRSITSTSRWAPTWTASADGGARGTTATTSPSTGPCARASPSATSARSAR